MSKAKPDAAAKDVDQAAEAGEVEQAIEQWYVAKKEPVFDHTEGVWFSQGIPRAVKPSNAFVKDALEEGRLERYDPAAEG